MSVCFGLDNSCTLNFSALQLEFDVVCGYSFPSKMEIVYSLLECCDSIEFPGFGCFSRVRFVCWHVYNFVGFELVVEIFIQRMKHSFCCYLVRLSQFCCFCCCGGWFRSFWHRRWYKLRLHPVFLKCDAIALVITNIHSNSMIFTFFRHLVSTETLTKILSNAVSSLSAFVSFVALLCIYQHHKI